MSKVEIERNELETVRVSINNYKGREYLDIRIFFKDDKDEWRPTKKGITLNPESIEELLGYIEKANKQLELVFKGA